MTKKEKREREWGGKRVNDSEDDLAQIPVDDKGAKEWINSRKADQHLDMDFLPRSLVYNYGDTYAESNKLIEDTLAQLGDKKKEEAKDDSRPSFQRNIFGAKKQEQAKKKSIM